MNDILPCLACRTQPEPVHPEMNPGYNVPYAATTFESTGHYGSTAFDPGDGSKIEVNICDECLNRARDDKIVLYHAMRRAAPTIWTGDEESGIGG